MEIKAKGKLDLESVKALAHLSMFKKADPKKRICFWFVVIAILCMVIVSELLAFGADAFLFVLLGLEILGFFLICFSYFIIPRIQYRSLGKFQNIENEYIFYDTALKVFSKSREYSWEAELRYSLIVKVYETSRYLFLYRTDRQVFPVDKSTIDTAAVEEIRNTLSAFVKEKYIICKY
jgi:hypothetical protein